MAQNTTRPQGSPTTGSPIPTTTTTPVENPIMASTVTQPTTIVKEPAPETVTMPKSELEALMKRLERVEYAADKAHLSNFDNKNREAMGKTVKLRLLNGKVILSWDNMLTNLVEKKPNGVWGEFQTVKINFEDNTSEELDLVVFNRQMTYLVADVIEENNINNGEKTILKVRTTDNRNYEIDSRFIN